MSFRTSEANFILAARTVLDTERYEIIDHPRELAAIFPATLRGDRDLGVIPEASVQSRETGRKFFVEVKKQGPAGNADERACKHHTVQFYQTLYDQYGYDYHPFVTIMCESLATLPRYTRKAPYLFEPEQYLLWVDYRLDILADYLNARCSQWLD